MTPDNSKPKLPRAPIESWWDAGAENRDLDKYFHWEFYCAAEDRSLEPGARADDPAQGRGGAGRSCQEGKAAHKEAAAVLNGRSRPSAL
jgi:hypothetical protein